MIERYFLAGVRLKWACPAADASGTKDGSIINDPRRNAAPMIYDGLDGELYEGGPHASTVGLSMGKNIPYSWLTYCHGHTTQRLLSAGDILTGPMSGCLIAEWTDQGMRWAGHVGTVESSAAINSKVKQNFGMAMPTQARGFYPDRAWSATEIASKAGKFKTLPRMNIMALVTSSSQFFSVLMFKLQGGAPNEWCVGGIKRVPPKNAVELRRDLLT